MTPPFPTPVGYEQLLERFGEIESYIRDDGTLRPEWERHILGIAELPAGLPLSWGARKPVTRIRCHTALVSVVEGVFREIHQAGLWGLRRGLYEFGGCFAFRTQRGSDDKVSTHAWGIALDLNVATNKLGTHGDMGAVVIQLFESAGFHWGGRFSRPDPQHFQFCRSY